MRGVSEAGCRNAHEDCLVVGPDAVPVIDGGRTEAHEAEVVDGPVAVPNHQPADPRISNRLGRSGDVVDPLRFGRRRLEIEQDVMRSRPEGPVRRLKVRLEPRLRLEFLGQPEEESEVLRDLAPHGRLVRVPVDAFVTPVLERRSPAHTERFRARKSLLEQMGLNALHGVEEAILWLAVDLKRDPGAVTKDEPEARADAHFEREALHSLRAGTADQSPDCFGIGRAEDRPLDGAARPDAFGDELRHAHRLAAWRRWPTWTSSRLRCRTRRRR